MELTQDQAEAFARMPLTYLRWNTRTTSCTYLMMMATCCRLVNCTRFLRLF